MTQRFRKAGPILLIAVASSAALLLVAAVTPSRISANTNGMTGMRMTQAPTESVKTVNLKRQRIVRVNIHSLAFGPARIAVSVGTKIIWTNQDSFQHTTTSDRGLWDSGPINPGANFVRVFKKAGTFAYHCTIHPFMHGTIIVTK